MAKNVNDVDVIVIGGGVAGLGAARELARRGRSVILIEARERLGGRIFSVSARGLRRAIELGAEFVHGGNADFRALARRAGLRMEPVSREVYQPREGRLIRADHYWTDTARLMKTIPANTRRSFAAFLKQWSKRKPADELARVRDHVESFNAAPAARMNAAALSADHAAAEQSQHRPIGGYSGIVEQLGSEMRRLGVSVRLSTEVTRVVWKRGAVTVFARRRRGTRGRRLEFRAKSAVVTLPLGVLKKEYALFSPRLSEKEMIIRRLGWGSVSRVTLRFAAAFWRRRFVKTGAAAKSPGQFPFVVASEVPIPVWWVPSREPLIVGWAGGPASERLQGIGSVKLRGAALGSLSRIWHVPQKVLRSHLRGFWSHDWSKDKYARGAYAYAVAGFEGGPAKLARPVERTLYFAGEATAEESGTVHGALSSGIAAARRLWAEHPQKSPATAH